MLAIIPARGGSKGLPGKNIKLFGDLPLICHTIKAALASKLIDRVIVSTENNKIASIAKNCGAEVPFMRSVDLASDRSLVMDSYLEVVDWISRENDKIIDSFVALLPTAPLRDPEDIDNAIKIFKNKKADSVISVVEAPVPIQWSLYIDDKKMLKNYLKKFNKLKNRQQEKKKTYVPNGSVNVFCTKILREKRQYFTNKTYPYLMPRERSVDIDDLYDFKWAEYLYNKKS
jgi:CMP-N,N'-diacetyllegionaminic acid synthase